MDKNLPDIDDLFRKALEDNEEFPSKNAWDGIEKKLDKDSVISIKRKYDFLKKVALLLLFLLAGLSIYVWKSHDSNPAKPVNDISEINKQLKTTNDTLTEESDSTTLQKSAQPITFNNLKSDTESSHKIIDKPILKEDNVSSKKSLNSATVKSLSTASIQPNKIKSKKPLDSDLSEASKFSIQKENELIKSKSSEVVKTTISNRIEDPHTAFIGTAGVQNGYKLPAIETLKLKDASGVKSNTADLLATKQTLHNSALGKINPLIQIEKTTVRKLSIKSTTQSRFALTAFYSPDIALYQFKDHDHRNANNTGAEHSETKSYSSTLGALVDYNFSEHWGLQSGITFATSNFDMDSDTIYAQRDNSGRIKYKLHTPLGDAYVLPSFRNTPNIGDSIFSKSPTHTLQYLGIPLAVKYNFNKGKFTLNALGGITANFLTRGRISTELESGADNETETTNKIYGLKPLYFSGIAGIGADYNIYKKFSISFSPTLHFALSAINSNAYEQSYPISLGLVLGLKMKL